MEKLRNIIARQQAELTQLHKDIAVLKTVNVNININNSVVDNENDNDNIDLITNKCFIQKSHIIDIDQKPKKVKKHKKSPTDEFKDVADEMFSLI
jgi:hypothetical protein